MPFVNLQPPDRLTYATIGQVYENMQAIYALLSPGGSLPSPDYNPVTGKTETTGYATAIADILPKMQRTEVNLDTLATASAARGCILPEYGAAVTWGAYTYNKYEKVKRWIDCLNMMWKILNGEIPKTAYLQTEDEEKITTPDGLPILCYGEEYFNGNSV